MHYSSYFSPSKIALMAIKTSYYYKSIIQHQDVTRLVNVQAVDYLVHDAEASAGPFNRSITLSYFIIIIISFDQRDHNLNDHLDANGFHFGLFVTKVIQVPYHFHFAVNQNSLNLHLFALLQKQEIRYA